MRTIGNTPVDGEVRAVASGTLPNGKPVIVNANGTVSVVDGEDVSQAVGSASVFESANSVYLDSTFDSTNNKFIVAYQDSGNSQRGTAVVGTVNASDNSISFGTPVVFQSSTIEYCAVVHDSTNNKIVIFYHDAGSTNYGKAIVGTVSGTSISFGTAVVFASVVARSNFAAFDSGNGKVVNVYRNSSANSTGDAVVGTVSGTSISFGSSSNWAPQNQGYGSVTYIGSSKFLIGYTGSSDHGNALIATLSGTSLSYGSSYVFRNSSTFDISSSYDSSTGKVVIVSRDNSSNGKAIVASISGTAITYGSDVTYASVVSSGDTSKTAITYDSTNDKMVISYQDSANSNYGTLIVGTVSGTSISFGTPVVFEAASTNYTTSVFDTNSKKVVVAYRDQGNSNYGTSVVFQNANLTTNLTSENYIGISRGFVTSTTYSEGFGSKNSIVGDANYMTAAYDSANNKLVIAYRDGNNSNYGTAVIGSINGTTVTFGTPVVFSSASQSFTQTIYDSSSGKTVILFYKNDSAISAIVGTVSGTSISFGSIVTTGNTPSQWYVSGAAVGSSKIVVAYRNGSDNFHGYGVVGTISGTSISFGTPVEFENATIEDVSVAYDSDSDKVVIAYEDSGNSSYGTAVVGTVSGTSISFGSASTFDTNGTVSKIGSAYDTNAGKVVIVYSQSSSYGIVGTVSGTSISFGSRVSFDGSTMGYTPGVVYNSIEEKVYIHYKNSSASQLTSGTVSGTSISFSAVGAVTGGSGSQRTSIAFISDQNALYNSFRDSLDDVAGTIYQIAYTAVTRGEVADGDSAVINSTCAISSNQLSLTAGQQYFVQVDGTLGLTPATPSVLAGTAVSATKLIVKG